MKRSALKHGGSVVFALCGILILYNLLISNIAPFKVNSDPDTDDLADVVHERDLGRERQNADDVESETGSRNPGLNDEGKNVNQRFTDDGVPKVIIVAYYRGGSSLTGALFNWNPAALYFFEPLHFLYQSAVGHGAPLVYYNGSRILAPSRSHELPFVYEILGGLLSCDFRRVDMGSLTGGMSFMSGSAIQEAIACQRDHLKDFEYLTNVCLARFRDNCLKAQLRTVKEIRLPMESTKALLKQMPSLKVIHVLRDSRGLLCSETGGSCKMRPDRVRQLCGKTYVDTKWRLMLEEQFPGRVKMIRYEDLAVEPIRTAQSIYAFLNLSLPLSVGRRLYNSTMKGHRAKGKLDVVRADSIATAFQWRQKISWEVLKSVQKYCLNTLHDGRYPFFFKEETLRKQKLPKRKHRKVDNRYII